MNDDIVIIGWCVDMGKERLREIALDILDLGDPLSVSVYISTMSESDIRLFLNYVRSEKYKDKDLYSACLAFSYDYLCSIGYSFPDNKAQKLAGARSV